MQGAITIRGAHLHNLTTPLWVGETHMLVEGDCFWRSVLAAGDTKLANRDQSVGWAKMPAEKPGMGINGQDFVTASGGSGYTLNPNTKHPKEAWALLSFMFSKDSLNAFEQIQPQIVSLDDVPVANDPVLTAYAKALLPITTIRPADPNYDKVSTAIQQMTEPVVSGTSPQQAASTYSSAVTGIVGQAHVEAAPAQSAPPVQAAPTVQGTPMPQGSPTPQTRMGREGMSSLATRFQFM